MAVAFSRRSNYGPRPACNPTARRVVLAPDHRHRPSPPALTQLSESDLVRECRRGRRAAQYELYRRYSGAMFGTCLRMCRGREDAEDVLQRAFSDVFAKLDSFRGESTVGAWIKRVTVNHCLSHLKRQRPRLVALDDRHHVPDPPPPPPDDDRTALDVARVKAAVAELPDGFRTVLTLYLFEGYAHREIAQVLDISEQTSKSQYSRARKRLRERLGA